MREPRFDAGRTGVCGLSLETDRWGYRQDWLFGKSMHKRSGSRRRALRIEPLEQRQLMDAAGLASSISPDWFESISHLEGPEHAGAATWTAMDTIEKTSTENANQTNGSKLYDWIVQFDTAALGGVHNVAETASLLVGGGIDFQVLSGLGLVGQVLVRSSGASVNAVEKWLEDNIYVSSFEQDAVRQFEATVVSNDPLNKTLWGMNKIDAQDAWGISTGDNSVVVAVIDTGVDYTHYDLASNIWTNKSEIAGNGIDDDGNGFVDDLHGYNFVANNGDPMDDNGHGTHVSGTIAAVGNNNLGVSGVNWSASIMALKFLNNTGQGYLSDAVRAINYATMQRTVYHVNVRVMNNSWGGGDFSTAMHDAIQASNDAGILFVAAAGNSGTNNDLSPQYPANYAPANVISVAASTQTDQLAYFSCYGATTVDIAAPGMSIYSTIPGNRYGSYSGTSMATPHVAGLAALAWAAHPDATVAEIRGAILQGADPVAALSGKVATGGRLNAFHTLQLLNSPGNTEPPPADPTPEPVQLPVSSTVGIYQPNTTTFYLNNANSTGNASSVFSYGPGNGNWMAISGDWNGDGKDSIGLYDTITSRFYLRNSNDAGGADIQLAYGPANYGWIPIAGDWNGDGIDTIGLYNPSTSVFYLRNSNTSGYADVSFTYGPAGCGWKPIVGDWNGDGKDTIALYNPTASVFYLKNSNITGVADITLSYGPGNSYWKPIAGDWNGDKCDTIGLYAADTSRFYLRNTNDTGVADLTFTFGAGGANATPIIGMWNGANSSSQSLTLGEEHSAWSVAGLQASLDASLLERHSTTLEIEKDATLEALHDKWFSGLAVAETSGDLLTALDNQIEHLLQEDSTSRRFSDMDVLESHQATLVRSLLLESAAGEQQRIDGIFELLESLMAEYPA